MNSVLVYFASVRIQGQGFALNKALTGNSVTEEIIKSQLLYSGIKSFNPCLFWMGGIRIFAKVLFGSFGSGSAAMLHVVFGKYKPGGLWPIGFTSSPGTARKQQGDVHSETKGIVYKFGVGLHY